jgi:hypothetical protein
MVAVAAPLQFAEIGPASGHRAMELQVFHQKTQAHPDRLWKPLYLPDYFSGEFNIPHTGIIIPIIGNKNKRILASMPRFHTMSRRPSAPPIFPVMQSFL